MSEKINAAELIRQTQQTRAKSVFLTQQCRELLEATSELLSASRQMIAHGGGMERDSGSRLNTD
jgi:hypothetical protein